ncbi:MAG: cytochrome c oxidase subunit II [Pseudomonadota bacterium]|nr:cytochrome c oxidase subunit II [Pseudomonadota bacterium]
MNYFLHGYGPISNDVRTLGWVFAAICTLVCLVIAGLLWHAMLRARHGTADEASVTDGEMGPVARSGGNNGVRAIAIGTGISTLILVAMTTYALVVLQRTAHPAAPVALTIDVTGFDWWWRVDYPAVDGARGFTTANEIHIPVGVPVRLRLMSADVIHAFWVPLLAGKTQMIPGLQNEQWLQADKPGVYRGQCTQYCGVQHAHMAVEVVAQTPSEFVAWLAAQRRPAGPASVAGAADGSKLFMERCAGCHSVRGTEAAGQNGPDLTHLNSRRKIAAGMFANTPAHLIEWITRAQEFKPGARMPSMPLTAAESGALSAYLATLD